ncbi:uncharacterized protein LOC123890228 isoform X2 [Trifolium pratense]|uniref:uncharacterized protein LOC123890228 isoform X2 n=1 Tax=Trifolium pratense TaxID=57577 RepID=UPI001E696FC3|nr:uncharacterized protein LOC123890228 isoform X2 [Trifolium pratense]
MEDGVTEVRSLFPPPNHNPEEGSKRKYNEENEEGFVSTEKAEKVKQKGLDIEEAKDSSSGGGGVISNFISNFMTPLSPRTGKVTTEDESGNEVFEKEEEIGNNGGEKGVISNLVSNFFHRNESEEGVVKTENKEKEDDEEIKGGEKIKRLKTDQTEANGGSSGGGGLIHDIVSHLPTSIPAPTADEATILINSLVRD